MRREAGAQWTLQGLQRLASTARGNWHSAFSALPRMIGLAHRGPLDKSCLTMPHRQLAWFFEHARLFWQMACQTAWVFSLSILGIQRGAGIG